MTARTIASLLFPVSVALVLFGWAWSMVIAQKLAPRWFLGVLLVPWLALPIFTVRHWGMAWRPVTFLVLGLALLAGAALSISR
jgi:hypothetical protein